MRVKIGDTWYDSDDQPVAVQLLPWERELVKQMDYVSEGKLAVYDRNKMSDDEARKWLED